MFFPGNHQERKTTVPALQYRLYRRANGIYYREDVQTKKQVSLKTKDKLVAHEKVRAANESLAQPTLNIARARIYMQAHDAESTKRTWDMVMNAYVRIAGHPAQRSQLRGHFGDVLGATSERWVDPLPGEPFPLYSAELEIVDSSGKQSSPRNLRNLYP